MIGHTGDDRLSGAAATLQNGITGIKGGIQCFFITRLIFSRKLGPGDDPGTAMDDQGGFRRFGGNNGRHKQDSGKYGGFHGFYPDWQASIIPNPAVLSPDAVAPRLDRAVRPYGRDKSRKTIQWPWSRPPQA